MSDKVLLFSQREISKLVAYSIAYEFEDTLASVSDCQRIDAVYHSDLDISRRAYKLVRLATGSQETARRFAPRPRDSVKLEGNFDLFFSAFSHSYELYSLALLPDWRKHCRKAACFINEIGNELNTNSLPTYLIELLSDFDHIFLGTRRGLEDVTRITGRPCSYLPLAVDCLRFAPSGPNQARPIEVCNIGRRSPVAHEQLLERAKKENSFYYYDTVAASGVGKKDRTFVVENASEHRQLLANILKRSSYFVANRSHVNKAQFSAHHQEISSRFYEGAAAGTIMIGEAPVSDEFKRQFDWPDAVINVPFHGGDIVGAIEDLNGNPQRLRNIRAANVREAMLRHDWLYRIQDVYDILGLPTSEKMRARAERLKQVSAQT